MLAAELRTDAALDDETTESAVTTNVHRNIRRTDLMVRRSESLQRSEQRTN